MPRVSVLVTEFQCSRRKGLAGQMLGLPGKGHPICGLRTPRQCKDKGQTLLVPGVLPPHGSGATSHCLHLPLRQGGHQGDQGGSEESTFQKVPLT